MKNGRKASSQRGAVLVISSFLIGSAALRLSLGANHAFAEDATSEDQSTVTSMAPTSDGCKSRTRARRKEENPGYC